MTQVMQEKTQNKEIQFTLDGQAVTAKPDETVLSVAKRCGIQIPALCHHEAVSSYGACRLCLVEVFWGKRSKLVTSCIYIPYEGDVVETNNDRVRRARRLALDLLWSRCPQVEVIAELAREYGIEKPSFRDQGEASDERCILCGLCIRVCDEVVGQNAISYAGRGTDRTIAMPFSGSAENCIGCGACVFVCPTGALDYEDIDGQRIMKRWNTALPLLNCRVCGRPFATEKQIAKIQERLNLPDELAATCPRCRGTEFRTVLEKVLKHLTK